MLPVELPYFLLFLLKNVRSVASYGASSANEGLGVVCAQRSRRESMMEIGNIPSFLSSVRDLAEGGWARIYESAR